MLTRTAGIITFAVPMSKFVRMINNMEESFLRQHVGKRCKRA
jgi:hypothetical protein